MHKPKLQNSLLPSTGLSQNLWTGTFHNRSVTQSKMSMKESMNPMISSFNRQSIRPNPIPITLKKQSSYAQQQTVWKNTSDIQNQISKNIQIDSQLSTSNLRNFATQKYFLGQERVCAQKLIQIPQPIKIAIQRLKHQFPEERNIPLVHGYIKGAHTVYYIVGTDLFLFNLDNLRSSKNNGADIMDGPIKIRPNCGKIQQIQFHHPKIFKNQINTGVLVFQFPYQIQLCLYKIEEKAFSNQVSNKNKGYSKKTITLVNLNTRIRLQSTSAQLIAPTLKGELLYLDEKSSLNCFSFGKIKEEGFQRKFKQQSLWNKRKFMARNQSFMKTARRYFWKIIDFRKCLSFSKRKNISLIYDQKRNRVYTLTVRGDVNTMLQQFKTQIKVYNFFHGKDDKIQLSCIWSIQQEQLLSELNSSLTGRSVIKSSIFSIQKVQAEYYGQADIALIMRNGAKLYLQVNLEGLKIIKVSNGPDVYKIQAAIKQRKDLLLSLSTASYSSKQNNNIPKKMNEPIKIRSEQYPEIRLRAYHDDQSLSINLMRQKQKICMHLILKRHNDSQNYDVFPIQWKQNNLFSNLENFPRQNYLYEVKYDYFLESTEQQILKLQNIQSQKDLQKNGRITRNKINISNSHELLRQVYCRPRAFTYLSNRFITNFVLLRPIDILYYFVCNKDEIFCQKYLQQILNVQPKQICSMLLQIYSSQKQIYYMSANFKIKTQNLLEKIKQNNKIYHALSEKTILFKITNTQNYIKQQRKILEQSQGTDKLEKIDNKISQSTLLKVKRLFIVFSRQCQKQDTESQFQQICIQNNKDLLTNFEQTMQDLSLQKKYQVQNALLYISRVFYPFWDSTDLTSLNKGLVLQKIKIKVRQINLVVDVLKYAQNKFYIHLHQFIQKILQVLQIFQHIPYLKNKQNNLTLQQAVNKQPLFFQQFIFHTLRRQNDPQILKLFKYKFPIYISKNFQILIKLFTEIRFKHNIEDIKRLLQRFNKYPQYFIDFLIQEKKISDIQFLKTAEIKISNILISLPDLPFENLLTYIFTCVRKQSIPIQEKFVYLKQAKKRLQKHIELQVQQKQCITIYKLQNLKKQYQQLFRNLKLQQQCKIEIIRMLHKQKQQKENSQQNRNLLKRVLSKLSFSSQISQNQNKSIEFTSKYRYNPELTCELYQNNEEMFNRLKYLTLNKSHLYALIQQIKHPRLQIELAHINLLEQKNRHNNMIHLQQAFQNLFQRGYNIVFDNQINRNKNLNTKLQKLSFYLKREVKQLYQFLNAVHITLEFECLYESLKNYLLQIQPQQLQLMMLDNGSNIQKFFFFAPRELVEIGFDRNLSVQAIFRSLRMANERQQIDLSTIDIIKRWIYDWWMAFDVILLYKKDIQTLQKLNRITYEFKREYGRELQKFNKSLKFIEQCQKKLFNLINSLSSTQPNREIPILRYGL